MSMFDTPSGDATSGVEPTAGAARGFRESVSNAFDAAWRSMSQFGVDVEMARANDAQEQRIFERTGKRGTRILLMDGSYMAGFGGVRGLGNFYEEGGTSEQADTLAKFDAEIEALRKEHPDMDLKTSRELWDGVKAAAVEAERVAESPGSTVGHFIGEAAAGLDPRVNPLNTLTLGVGGVGSSVARRVVGEAGAQSAIQAVNELTGVNANRRLLGLETGFGQSLSRIAQAGLAGGVIRGGFEGAARLWRGRGPQVAADPSLPATDQPGRNLAPDQSIPTPAQRAGIANDRDGALFRDFEDFEEAFTRSRTDEMIDDVARETASANLYGRTRLAEARHEQDLASVEAQLQDFRRNGPVRVGDTASIQVPTHAEITVPHWMRSAEERVPGIAREVDPELYAQLDKLDRLIAAKRAEMEGLQGGTGAKPDQLAALDTAMARADEIEDDIAKLRDQLQSKKFNKATTKRINKQIGELEALQRSILEPHQRVGRAEAQVHESRAELIRDIADLTDQRRALSPLKKRAEQIAAQRFEDSRAKGQTFELMTSLLRREWRIADDMEVPSMQTRRPSEQATAAQGGSELAPGTRRRAGTTSGPNPSIKPNDGSPLDNFIDDVAHENANEHEIIRAAFEAADAVRTGAVGARTVDWDAAALKREFADAKGEVDGARLSAQLDAEAKEALESGGSVTMYVEGKPRKIVKVTNLGLIDDKGNPWGKLPLLMQKEGDSDFLRITYGENHGEVVIGNRRYKLDDDFVVGVTRNDTGEVTGVEMQKVRDVLKEFNDDADMLQAMKGCSI